MVTASAFKPSSNADHSEKSGVREIKGGHLINRGSL